MYGSETVIVMQTPERLDQTGAEIFFKQVKPGLESTHPRLVVDFSETQHIDCAGVEMLLRCMEEAMKRDGDVKLAGVSPSAAVILELMKVDRLFEIFDTPAEAVRSFHALSPYSMPTSLPWMEGGETDLEAAG